MSRLIGRIYPSARSQIDITVEQRGEQGWSARIGKINSIPPDSGGQYHRSEDAAIAAAQSYIRRMGGELIDDEPEF